MRREYTDWRFKTQDGYIKNFRNSFISYPSSPKEIFLSGNIYGE